MSEKLQAQCAAKEKEHKIFQFQLPSTVFMSQEEEDLLKVPLVEKPLSQGPSSSLSGKLYKVQYVLQFSLKHDVVGASQKTMPEAQIPIMIMTPNKSCILLDKPKTKKHPMWQPYGFEALDFHVSEETEKDNEYAQYRKWLIQKEKEFVEEQLNPNANNKERKSIFRRKTEKK